MGEVVPRNANVRHANGDAVLGDPDVLIQTFRRSLSPAEINAAYANPIELLPPPGANSMYLVLGVAMNLRFNTTATANGGTMYIQYGNAPNAAGPYFAVNFDPKDETYFNAAATSLISGLSPFGFVQAYKPADVNNLGLYFTNDGAAYTGGDYFIDLDFFYFKVNTQ